MCYCVHTNGGVHHSETGSVQTCTGPSILSKFLSFCRSRKRTGSVNAVPRKNVVVALECSTFSTLMDAAAFEKLGQPDWLVRAPAIVSICILVAAWNECIGQAWRGCLCEFYCGLSFRFHVKNISEFRSERSHTLEILAL